MNLDFLNEPRKVLAIDDSKMSRAIIINVLTQLNIQVDEARDGLEGLEAIQKNNYDLILVDLIMPNIDGFEFISRFRDITGESFIPIILMTGSDDLNSKIKGLTIGADDFLYKPLNEKELVARVLSLLRLKVVHMELYDKNQQIKKELEIAKRVQEFIIPKDFSQIDYPLITGIYLPIEDIGGDYFDCYELPDNKVGFIIADVTGHGIPAALVMTMSKMIFSIYAAQYPNPKELLSVVNWKMRGLLLDTQYITSFFVIFNRNTNTIHFSNAGHTRALFYRATSQKILALDTNGFFIGISDDQSYEEKSLRVQSGDKMLLYTDGVTEIKNSIGQEFGEKGLATFIRQNNTLRGRELCDALIRTLRHFTALEKRNDDIALLLLDF